MLSQCSNCGKNFKIIMGEVLFCSKKCEKEHNIFENIQFSNQLIDKKMPGFQKPGKIRQQHLNYTITRC